MIFKNTTQLTEASLACSCRHLTSEQGGFSDPLGVAKTVSRGGQKFSKAVQLPDSPPSSRTLDKLQEIGTLLSDLVTLFQ